MNRIKSTNILKSSLISDCLKPQFWINCRMNIYLILDQPAICPQCGSPTHRIYASGNKAQLHKCPYPNCLHIFLLEEE